tara:strand:- start:90 stop:353 length:264 start_codon:yes stop_codon:yes gene_type:complete
MKTLYIKSPPEDNEATFNGIPYTKMLEKLEIEESECSRDLIVIIHNILQHFKSEGFTHVEDEFLRFKGKIDDHTEAHEEVYKARPRR